MIQYRTRLISHAQTLTRDSIISAFAQKDREKSRKTSVKATRVQSEIRTQHLPTPNLERYLYVRLFSTDVLK
jgi:hypothetical protein